MIILQLTPSISNVITTFLHRLRKTCNFQHKWTADVYLWKLLVWLHKICTFCAEKISHSDVPLLSKEQWHASHTLETPWESNSAGTHEQRGWILYPRVEERLDSGILHDKLILTHFKVLMVPAASYCLWDPDSYSWQTTCMHVQSSWHPLPRTAAQSSFMTLCLAVLLLFTNQRHSCKAL